MVAKFNQDVRIHKYNMFQFFEPFRTWLIKNADFDADLECVEKLQKIRAKM